MKDYNSKFKSIGYEYVIENSSSTHSEYVKTTADSYKRIAITFSGEGKMIMCHEMVKNREGDFVEVQVVEFTPEEVDAIKSFISDTEFSQSVEWDEENQRYVKRRKNGNN